MTGPVAATVGTRLHLQHGPIDLLIEAFGDRGAVDAAYQRARARFSTILEELVAELGLLRAPLGRDAPTSPVGGRMARAVARFPGGFITPMAAVAGAVADEMCEAMVGGGLERAYVNNGGDIALFLSAGATFDVGLVPVPHRPVPLGKMTITTRSRVRGVATSGRHGRSMSLGIADAVTALAESAAGADTAATLIANAVDLPGHPGIARTPACEIDPDSDLVERLVTVDVGGLSGGAVADALRAGAEVAAEMERRGDIVAAVLCLEGEVVTVGSPDGSRRLGSGIEPG